MAKSQKSDEATVPNLLDPEWNDYVLSQLTEDEKIDGYPVVAGLRRLAEIYIGQITFSAPTHITPVAGNGFGRATAAYEITFLKENGVSVTFGDVADVWEGNVDEPFLPFAVAVAATRAEARALRKALKLRVIAAEERASTVAKVSDTTINQESISDNQIKFINMTCQKLNINVVKFFNAGERQYSNVKQISKSTAAKMIQELNRLQNAPQEIPANIIGYISTWQESFK